MDYSIHDAIETGFNHVVFIIRKDIEKEFKEVIGDHIASICSSHNVNVDYAFQDINDIPGDLRQAGQSSPRVFGKWRQVLYGRFCTEEHLSDNGGVTRGICKTDENGNLTFLFLTFYRKY